MTKPAPGSRVARNEETSTVSELALLGTIAPVLRNEFTSTTAIDQVTRSYRCNGARRYEETTTVTE